MERLKRNHQEEVNGRRLVDLTQEKSFIDELKQPIRILQFSVGPIFYRIPRAADDPTPDNIVKVAGKYVNLTDGRVGANLSSVK